MNLIATYRRCNFVLNIILIIMSYGNNLKILKNNKNYENFIN